MTRSVSTLSDVSGPLPLAELAPAARAVVESLAAELARRWDAGERPLLEELLAGHPELADVPEAVLELLAEELSLRQEHGTPLPPSAFLARFPRWRRQVEALLGCYQLLAAPAGERFPAVGESLGEFDLVAELGRGSHGRVFLASQPALAGRHVVLKLAPAAGQEHLSLARLQHSHIVPLYSVHEFPEVGLRGLCLPYFGGITLATLLRALAELPVAQRTGRDLVDRLRRAGEPEAPACRFLARASYVQAVCWVGACLADALQYAHERGLLHLDLKPSNVLLAGDGVPMLLDFHLARGPVPAGKPDVNRLGGTPGYMAPEQEAALLAMQEGMPLPQPVDARADLYALGVVLYECLAGELPWPGARLRVIAPHVSVGLADILARCLSPVPQDRYPSASDLAADLRRQLADLPLRGVRNRSLKERWDKWRRRRPSALPLAGLLVAALTAGGFSLLHVSRQADLAGDALRQGRQQLAAQHYPEALETFRHGAALVRDLPWCGELLGELQEGIEQGERAKAAGELHSLCEQLRPLYGEEQLSRERAQAVEGLCRQLWEQHQQVVRRLDGQPKALERQVRTDLLDLALLWADLLPRCRRPGEQAEARAEALAVLDQAEKLLGRSCVLLHERRLHALALGRKDVAERAGRQAEALSPQTAWEHYALGRAYLRAGDKRAGREMEQAVRLQPGALWANFYRGKCAFALGRYDDAVVSFSVCAALAPDSAWCFYLRARAYGEQGQADRARADLDEALRLDPNLGPAALRRGLLHYGAGNYPEALADLDRALRGGLDKAVVRYNQALVHLARDDRRAAVDCLRRALEHSPDHEPARALLEQLGGG